MGHKIGALKTVLHVLGPRLGDLFLARHVMALAGGKVDVRDTLTIRAEELVLTAVDLEQEPHQKLTKKLCISDLERDFVTQRL